MLQLAKHERQLLLASKQEGERGGGGGGINHACCLHTFVLWLQVVYSNMVDTISS